MNFKPLVWEENYFKGELSGYISRVYIKHVVDLEFVCTVPTGNKNGKYYYSYYINNQLMQQFNEITMEEAIKQANATYNQFMNELYNDIQKYVM